SHRSDIKKASRPFYSTLCANCSNRADWSGWTVNTGSAKNHHGRSAVTDPCYFSASFWRSAVNDAIDPEPAPCMPDSEIDVLVFPNTAGIVAGNPDINHVISMPERPAMKESARLFGRLWRHYDIAVSTQSGDRPTIFAFAAARLRAGVTTNDDPWLARMLKS